MSNLIQPFPKKGKLADNLNLPLAELKKRIGRSGDAARSYIIATVKLDDDGLACR